MWDGISAHWGLPAVVLGVPAALGVSAAYEGELCCSGEVVVCALWLLLLLWLDCRGLGAGMLLLAGGRTVGSLAWVAMLPVLMLLLMDPGGDRLLVTLVGGDMLLLLLLALAAGGDIPSGASDVGTSVVAGDGNT